MRALIMIFWSLFLPQQEVSLEVLVSTPETAIFAPYHNSNFAQEVVPDPEARGIRLRIHSQSVLNALSNDPLLPDQKFLASQDGRIVETFQRLFRQSHYLGDFFRFTADFLRAEIRYSEDDLPQDALSVLLNRRAHCVGFANLMQVLLRGAGIPSRQVKGFYLREEGGRLLPQSHRWLEVQAFRGLVFFYDPQYQDFASRYILVQTDLDFQRLEKFSVQLLSKRIRILQ